MKRSLHVAAALVTAMIAVPALANTMPYTPSSAMPVLPYPGYTFSLAKLSDGDTTTMNGFASTRPTGTISLRLNACGTVNRLTIYNNINGGANGVKAFTLNYYGQNGTLLGSQTATINNAAAAQTIVAPTGPGLPAGTGMQFVQRIDIVITASFDRQVELREIVVDGTPSPRKCCP